MKTPIQVSDNGRYFIAGNNQPFFWLGDTGWPLLAEYSKSDAEKYLDNRAQKGFTVIQCVLAWGKGTGMEKQQPVANCEGECIWDNSPENINEAFFRHVDWCLDCARRQNLILAMLPTWGYYISNAKLFTEKTAYDYGLYLGKRYKNTPNIVWVNGGDRTPETRTEIYRALGQGLREGDSGAHLITYHPCGNHSSAEYFHTEPWLDFNMIQTWTDWPRIYPFVGRDYAMAPVKPVVLGEPAYEDGPEYPLGPITPLIVRRQAWWTFMAGGFFTYGQNQMWRMEENWTDCFDRPGTEQMTIFRKICESRSWWKLVPDQSMFTDGMSSGRTLNAAMRADDGSFAMLYLSSQCRVKVQAACILSPRVKATLINPATGEENDDGEFETGHPAPMPKGNALDLATPEGWEDAVILLDGMRR
jgi:hypothetical protein